MRTSQCCELYFHFFIPQCVHHQLWAGFCTRILWPAEWNIHGLNQQPLD